MEQVWTLYTDGASRGNPGLSAAGAFAISPQKKEYEFHKFLGTMTNNQAEYEALIFGLGKLIELSVKNLVVKADSELMIKQLKGEYRVKNANMIPLYKKVITLVKELDHITFEHVTRDKNKKADQLANIAIDDHLALAK